MHRTLCKSKIHRATVTDANLAYEGSITLDPVLLEAADLLPFEQVHVVNINNGARFETYTIVGRRGSGDCILNGAAARLVQPGDQVIIISYGIYDEAELEGFEPKVILVDEQNRIREPAAPTPGKPPLSIQA
jgi:aspartate 1-decarboxylase